MDTVEKFKDAAPEQRVVYVRSKDPVTGSEDMVFLLTASREIRIRRLQEKVALSVRLSDADMLFSSNAEISHAYEQAIEEMLSNLDLNLITLDTTSTPIDLTAEAVVKHVLKLLKASSKNISRERKKNED